ncbi:MAG TPA: hypothetical protein VGI39_42140 [Polyangiaceae bacterium]
MLNARRARLLRGLGAGGFVLGFVAAVGVALACGACGASDSNGAAEPPGSDAEVVDASSDVNAASDSAGVETGPSDAGGDADTGPLPHVSVTYFALHASPNLDEFRMCFATSYAGADAGVLGGPPLPSDPAQPIPDTNLPGVAIGRGAQLPSILVPVGSQVTPLLVRVNAIFDNPRDCSELFCQGLMCVKEGDGYFALSPQTISQPGAFLLSVEGCAPLSLATPAGRGSAAECGADYDPVAGNLSARFIPVDLSAAAPWSVRVAAFSSSLDVAGGDASVALRYVNPAADASVPLPLGGPSLALPSTLPLDDAGVTAAYFALSVDGGDLFRESLLAVQHFESPGSNPYTFFASSTSYLVAVMGDATDAAAPMTEPDGAPNPSFDGHGLHLVTYPIVGSP